MRPARAAEPVDERTARLIAAGRIRPPGPPLPDDFWDDEGPADPEGRALSGLLAERAEGR